MSRNKGSVLLVVLAVVFAASASAAGFFTAKFYVTDNWWDFSLSKDVSSAVEQPDSEESTDELPDTNNEAATAAPADCGTISIDKLTNSPQQKCIARKAANCEPGFVTVTLPDSTVIMTYTIKGKVNDRCKILYNSPSSPVPNKECLVYLEDIDTRIRELSDTYEDSTQKVGIELLNIGQPSGFHLVGGGGISCKTFR